MCTVCFWHHVVLEESRHRKTIQRLVQVMVLIKGVIKMVVTEQVKLRDKCLTK